MLTIAILDGLWPQGDRQAPGLRAAMVAASEVVFRHCGLTSALTVAHAMAQFSHECGAGTELVENLNYSAEGLVKTWPSRFTAATAAPLSHHPERIANAVYDGRMGNRPGSDDGWTYRGRGGSQVTGRDAYAALSHTMGLDLLGTPDLVVDPAHFLACAVADFVQCGCLPFAARDDVAGVTYHLNGGYIGLDERRQWLARWKAALGVAEAGGTSWIQDSLNRLGARPALTVDGQYGPATVAAMKVFQGTHHLPADGKAAATTLAALAQAVAAPAGYAEA